MSQTLQPPATGRDPRALAAAPFRRTRSVRSIVVLVPAHDAEREVVATLTMLREQTRRPDRVVVVADGCTDRTALFARQCGAEVVETLGNQHGPAGALNQALRGLLALQQEERSSLLAPRPVAGGRAAAFGDEDVVLVLAPGRVLDPRFLQVAAARLDDPAIGAVGALARLAPATEGPRLLGAVQHLAHGRGPSDDVLSALDAGVALYPLPVLAAVARARAECRLPDASGAGAVLDVASVAPERELALAVRRLGWGLLAPAGCTHDVQPMTSWSALAAAHHRAVRGRLGALLDHGWNPTTRGRWWAEARGPLALSAIVLALAVVLTGHAPAVLAPVLLLAVAAQRAAAVVRRGPLAVLLAAALVPEAVRALALSGAWTRAVTGATARAWRSL